MTQSFMMTTGANILDDFDESEATPEHVVKEVVRERDGNRCVQCGMTNDEHLEKYSKSLQVHRMIPGIVYDEGSCILLCQPCHYKRPSQTGKALWDEHLLWLAFNLLDPDHKALFDSLLSLSQEGPDNIPTLAFKAIKQYLDGIALEQSMASASL